MNGRVRRALRRIAYFIAGLDRWGFPKDRWQR